MTIGISLVKAGVGLGAAVLGAGALIYEAALNTKLNSKFVSMFDHPDPEQTALYEGDAYGAAQQWFNENKGDDKVISGESGAAGAGFAVTLMTRADLASFKEELGIDENSVILCFSTEGDTDKKNYRDIVWDGKYPSFE